MFFMIQVKAKPLSKDAFAKYGEYLDLTNNADLEKVTDSPGGFWPNAIQLIFGGALPPTVSVCQALKVDKIEVHFFEGHEKTCEGLLPIDGDVVIYVGPGIMKFGPPPYKAPLDKMEAFIVPKGTFVKLNPYVTHGSQFALNEQEVHLLCLLPNLTASTDMTVVFDPNDGIEIVL
jgi:ureidoglycolate lyase